MSPGTAAARRELVEDFVTTMYTQKDVATAFDTYVAADYVQHNPGLPDGRDAARGPLAEMFADPDFTPEVVRLLVDGDLCAVHLRISRGGLPVAAVVDVYRWLDDHVVEHWDVIQPWPATAANDHPMF